MQLRPEPKKTVRRSKKKAEEEAAKAAGLTDITSTAKSVAETPVESAATPKAVSVATKTAISTKVQTPSSAEESKKTIPTAPSKVPIFKPEIKKDDNDLESIATGK